MCDLFFLGVPVTSVKWRIHPAATKPTPHKQNRGRRRVCLGLLGTLMSPEAAGSPVTTCCPSVTLVFRSQGSTPPACCFLLDLNDGVLASAVNVRETRLSGCVGLTPAPRASSCTQPVSVAPQRPHPTAATPAARERHGESSAMSPHTGSQRSSHVPPDPRWDSVYIYTVYPWRCFPAVSEETDRERRRLAGWVGRCGRTAAT